MTPALVDTDILSFFLRGDPRVVAAFEEYVAEHQRINISIVTYYEVLSGLRHRDARRQASDFLALANENNVLMLTQRSCSAAADIYAQLRREGVPIDDIDILIAGIAVANGLVMATHNTDDFGRIPGLRVEDWSHA